MDIKCTNYSISFAGYTSKFSKTLNNAITNQKQSDCKHHMLKSITEFCDKKMKPDRKLGSGFYSTIYKIDDKYVLKSDNHVKKPYTLSDIILHTKPKFKRLKHYFGESVATVVNMYGPNFHILKNVYSKGKPIPAGIPAKYAREHTYNECLEYYKNVYLPTFSSLPQRSFDGIAQDCAELNKIPNKKGRYVFDYLNPNNFVLAGKTLRIVDDLSTASEKTKMNSVSDLLSVFVTNMDLDYASVYDPQLVHQRRILSKKIILAGVKSGLPMSDSKTDFGMWIETISLLDTDMSKESIIHMAKFLDNIVKDNKNVSKRIQLAKKYLEEVVNI